MTKEQLIILKENAKLAGYATTTGFVKDKCGVPYNKYMRNKFVVKPIRYETTAVSVPIQERSVKRSLERVATREKETPTD